MTNQFSDGEQGLEAEEFISFVADLGGADLVASTMDLETPGVTAAVWKFDRMAANIPPSSFHLLGVGLAGKHTGHQSFEALKGPDNIVISPGAVFLVPAGQAVLASGLGQVSVLHIMMEKDLLNRATNSTEELTLNGFNRRLLPDISIPALSMFREVILAKKGLEIMIRSLAQMIAGELVQDQLKQSTPSRAQPPEGLNETAVATVVEHIENNIDKPLDMGILASEIGLGPALLERGFEQSTGISTQRYIQSARLNRAFYELACETTSVDEIAKTTGYKDPEALTHALETELDLSMESIRPASVWRQN